MGLPYARVVGMDHRIESHMLGFRDLTDSPSARNAAKSAGLHNNIEAAELHAPFSHQEILLRQSLGLSENVDINPSGGALAGNVMMAAGLDRIGSMAAAILRGDYKFGLAHATSGPCLQQNLVTILEAA
jgi:acetyl-CoA acetyltransferase